MRGRVLRHHDGAMIEEPKELVPGELCGGGVALKRARQLVLRSLLLCSVERLAPSVALSQLVKNDEIMHVLVQLITSPRKPCTDCRECIMYDRPCWFKPRSGVISNHKLRAFEIRVEYSHV